MRTAVIAAIALAFLAQAPAPAVQVSTVIAGRVLDADTTAPVRGAVVSLRETAPAFSSAAPSRSFLTTADGVFLLQNPPAGEHNLTVSKPGYLDTHEAERVRIANGHRLEGVVVRLTRASSITGRVVDPAGDPVTATVRLERNGAPPGTRPATTWTDDQGTYFFGGLAAGEYRLDAGRSVAAMSAPNLPTLGLTLTQSQQREGVDIQVPWEPTTLRTLIVDAGKGTTRTIDPGARGGSISGTVRNVHGRSVANVTVIAVPVDESQHALATWATNTDDRGNYFVSPVAAGRYWVMAMRTGALSMSYGAARSNIHGKPIEIIDGQPARDIDIVLPEAGVIAGTVRDESGDPARATVTLVVPSIERGFAYGGTKTTDSLGRYRFSNLRPGQYAVMATRDLPTPLETLDANDVRMIGSAPLFYPGVPSLDLASVITIEAGTLAVGIDVDARPVPVAPVDVSVSAGDLRLEDVMSWHMAVLPGAPSERIANNRQIDWRPHLPAGLWRFGASARVTTSTGEETRWALQESTTDGRSAQAITLSLEPAPHLSGRVQASGNLRPPTAAVWLQRLEEAGGADPSRVEATVDAATGAFTVLNRAPGRYLVAASDKPRGGTWTLIGATLDGRDVLDKPLDLTPGTIVSNLVLTISPKPSELRGVLSDSSARPLAGATLLIVPTDAAYHWRGCRRIVETQTDNRGRYSVSGLPAGMYRIGIPLPLRSGADFFQLPRRMTLLGDVPISDGSVSDRNLTAPAGAIR